MVKDGALEVLRILSDASATIAQGEVRQLTTANNLETTMDDYIDVISAKTAALFAAACEIGPVIAGADEKQAAAMREYGLNLGIAFQIADDVLDFSADRAKLGKTVGDDFREGKITAPILFALENADTGERTFWQRTIADKNQSEGDLEQAQKIIDRHDANARALDLAYSYSEKARSTLTKTKDGPISACLDDLARFTVERSH